MRTPTVRAVAQALLLAGARRATGRAGGFVVAAPTPGTVVVRWRAPEHEPGSDAGLAFLEEYARFLRDGGICALVATDAPEPRVLCSAGPVIGQRAGARVARHEAN